MEVLLEDTDMPPPPRTVRSGSKPRAVRKASTSMVGTSVLEDIPTMPSSLPSFIPKGSGGGSGGGGTKTSKEDIDALFPVEDMIIPGGAAKKKVVKKVVKKKVVRTRKSTATGRGSGISSSAAQASGGEGGAGGTSKNPYSFFNATSEGDSRKDAERKKGSSSVQLPSLSDDDDIDLSPPTYASTSSSHSRSSSTSRATVLPSLASDSDEDEGSRPPVGMSSGAGRSSSGLELPEFGLQDSEDELDEVIALAGPPVEENLEYWRKRAIGAEIEAEKATKRVKKQKQDLAVAKKTIQKLRLKEKKDAEQMEGVLHQLESSLQQSRAGYQAQITKLNKQLEAAKLMIQHLQQTDSVVELPENFQEYYDFLVTGKRQAHRSADRIQELATSAEVELKRLIGGCNALKDVADALRTLDAFADPPQMPQ